MKDLKSALPNMVIVAYIVSTILTMIIDVEGDVVVLLLGLILIMLYAKD